MGKRIDLRGQKFGRLTVIELAYINKKQGKYWYVKCDCKENTIFTIRGSSLTSGNTNSCGCLIKEITSDRLLKKNEYNLSGEFGIGYTSKGEEFYFDLEDYDKIKNYCWYIDKAGYVRTNRVIPNIKFHNFILEEDDITCIDHIFGDTNDNRKQNLRIANKFENAENAKLRVDNKSGTKGVKWDKKTKQWVGQIQCHNKRFHLGYFKDLQDAIKTREIVELYLFKNFSRRYNELKNKYKDINIEYYIKINIPEIIQI